ncbi:Calcium-binding EF-hand [Sphingobium herbicidovorans NBRC 16415]|uniref:Calcium-binding EF-hand n=1 Tax=Sphingobium herbicidovorans (strain ATCC 700291 / DSM 11019 / CCUG 56400 / KCTC 2939 / LMG 18315 / NBRC 16415 / MH) TaxID=1219045 RepID=A0A086PCJ0_SPHHM|nr:EF-hand domain-containing protein [Sphingobium herbicidovorans]KFG91108.1 Calcium-binding EF-hand [Sphingobium herbicidovorans NBRC 16415]
MLRGLLISAALASALPAIAQEASSSPSGNPQAGSAIPTPAPADSVASIVDAEFPAYDANSDGELDKAEFSRWMVALKDQEMKSSGQKLAPPEITAWADGAFATADKDKSMAISKAELISYLSGGEA